MCFERSLVYDQVVRRNIGHAQRAHLRDQLTAMLGTVVQAMQYELPGRLHVRVPLQVMIGHDLTQTILIQRKDHPTETFGDGQQ